MKKLAVHTQMIVIMLLACAGACKKSAPGNSAIALASVDVKDTIDFDLKNVTLFPESVNSTNEDYAFSYSDRSFYYIKTLDENQARYAIVKCDLDNKEIAISDISEQVESFIQEVADSGLCKTWQSCFQFDLETFPRSVVLTINFSGEEIPDEVVSRIVVFDPDLKMIDGTENVNPEYYLAKTKIVSGSDSLLRDLKGTELVSYKDTTPSVIYQAKENEVILCDRHSGKFYHSVVREDTLSILGLSEKQKIPVKLYGVEKTSFPLFIHNELLFLFHHGNLYTVDLRSRASTGYKITPDTYTIYPNSTGFFCDYPAFEDPGSAGFKHAYSFIPLTDSK